MRKRRGIRNVMRLYLYLWRDMTKPDEVFYFRFVYLFFIIVPILVIPAYFGLTPSDRIDLD